MPLDLSGMLQQDPRRKPTRGNTGFKKRRPRLLKKIAKAVFVLAIFALGATACYFYLNQVQKEKLKANIAQAPEQEKNIYIEFLFEVYDKIQENYWDNITNDKLSNLFKLATEKLAGPQPELNSKDKTGLETMWHEVFKNIKQDKIKEFTANTASLVLANLPPNGRSGLYTEKQEQQLSNMVQNINPDKDLYAVLDLEKGASQQEIETNYQQKIVELEKDTSQEAEQKRQELSYAYGVLKQEETKQNYDEKGVEPTVIGKVIGPKIFHLRITRFSPTTYEEFQKVAGSADDNQQLDTLILDLRGNIGGSIDILVYFLGPFIGQNQYAYEFFRKGQPIPYKTKTGWISSLVKYKKVVVLIDGQSQSTAELMAATLKKYNVGIVLGTRTKGWGTVEKVYQLENQFDPENEKYSMFVVNHLTLRDDGQPIEGNGVEPTINIEDPDWKAQLYSYLRYNELAETIEKIWSQQ